MQEGQDTEDRRSGSDRRSAPRRAGDNRGLKTYRRLTPEKRDEMVKKHLKLVSFVVSRLAISLPDHVDRRDLMSAGVLGLIDAVNNFDQARGVKFETYAKTRIRGAIIDELRALDWIPRSTRSKSREIERAIAALVGRLGRYPTDNECADELGWDLDKYYKALGQVSVTTLLSLDENVESASSGGAPIRRIDLVSGEVHDPLADMEHAELLTTMVRMIGELNEQERLVIALYYYEELTLKEIGMVMNVTESRISQIHTAAVLKLKSRLRTAYRGSE